jgi:hypothetical protein
MQFPSTFFGNGPVRVYLDSKQKAWNKYRNKAAYEVPGTFEAHTFLTASGVVTKKKPAGYPVS